MSADAEIAEGLRRAYAHLVREQRARGVPLDEHTIRVQLDVRGDVYAVEVLAGALVEEPAKRKRG